MSQRFSASESVFRLSSRIQVFPIRHGSGDMAQEVRDFLVTRQTDCLAIPLPPSVEDQLERGISRLPTISLVVLPEPDQHGHSVHSFVPVDPCQPFIMSIRLAMNEGISRAYIDRDVAIFEHAPNPQPDSYALKTVSLAAYASALLPFLPAPLPSSQQWKRIAWMAFRLHELELDYRSIICVCSLEDWPWLRTAYQDRHLYDLPDDVARPTSYIPTVPSLYFVLGELPFVTELYERRRVEARADTYLSLDGIKELLLETRVRWLDKRNTIGHRESHWITPQLLQMYLQYVRNLALQEHRFIPDLYTLVLAAKQMGGDEFALTLLETAKTYAYHQLEDLSVMLPLLTVGIGECEFPDGEISIAKNRLEGQPLFWRSLSLRPSPPQPRKRNWAYQWNPYHQCSWPPEDNRIEAFTAHVRSQARMLLGTEITSIEKFTTSIRDGIDLRETLRHWKPVTELKTSDIYIRERPPNRGKVEVLVFLFEVPSDPEKYPWRATWYAEHDEESTLCFFASPFLDNMVGPGIGQSYYGGALFLFPPRLIPDVWVDPRFDFTNTLEERLLAAACAYSLDSHVALVSPVPVNMTWRHIARRYSRRLVFLPLQRFSGQTIDRLRQFHVLNGHDIRSYAAQFIRK